MCDVHAAATVQDFREAKVSDVIVIDCSDGVPPRLRPATQLELAAMHASTSATALYRRSDSSDDNKPDEPTTTYSGPIRQRGVTIRSDDSRKARKRQHEAGRRR